MSFVVLKLSKMGLRLKAEDENVELSVRKREVKLTAKGLMAKLNILQKQRKSKFDKASQLKKTIQELMGNREYKNEVKGMIETFETQCKEAKEAHESLIVLLPDVDKEPMEHGSKQRLYGLWDSALWCINGWRSYRR